MDKDHTVYEAEAVGITLAAKLLLSEPNPQKLIHILVDNQAAIKSGERTKSKPGHYILHKLRRIIREACRKHNLKRNDIVISWVPGHEGIQGNGRGDEEARKAAENPLQNSATKRLPLYLRTTPLPSSLPALKCAHRELSKE